MARILQHLLKCIALVSYVKTSSIRCYQQMRVHVNFNMSKRSGCELGRDCPWIMTIKIIIIVCCENSSTVSPNHIFTIIFSSRWEVLILNRDPSVMWTIPQPHLSSYHSFTRRLNHITDNFPRLTLIQRLNCKLFSVSHATKNYENLLHSSKFGFDNTGKNLVKYWQQ